MPTKQVTLSQMIALQALIARQREIEAQINAVLREAGLDPQLSWDLVGQTAVTRGDDGPSISS